MELTKLDSAWNGGTRGDGYDADLYMDGRGTYYVCAYMAGQTATREFLVRETDDEDEARAWMRGPVTCEYDEAGDALLAAMAEADERGDDDEEENEMALPMWYEYGRNFAFDVVSGGPGAGAFLPNRAMDVWLCWVHISDTPPLSPECDDETAECFMEVLRWCATIPDARKQFEAGYRDGMRETRLSRKQEAHA